MTWSASASGHIEPDKEQEALQGILDALLTAHASSVMLAGNFHRVELTQDGYKLVKVGG